MIKRILLCLLVMIFGFTVEVHAEESLELTAKSAILMEAKSGTCIYEKEADTKLSPASITKIMTLILIFDALDEGKIHLNDEVTTSAYAKSRGGSQVFLEEGEVQTVETMIKCIIIASANDASVAMAEHLAGSEEEFVKKMNERAKGLGMKNTVFEDCCGLTDSKTHLTTARDVAIMSRELITHYPQIKNYSTIWMDTIIHKTKQGEKEFGLSNTNKLLKMGTSFEVTGLKTGSTSLAKYCVSATGKKDGVELIAVIMAAPDYKARFPEAKKLLDYGFSSCTYYKDEAMPKLASIPVTGGNLDSVELKYMGQFETISTKGENFKSIEKKLEVEEKLIAPVKEGQKVGRLVYSLNGKEIGSVNICTKGAVEKAKFFDYFKQLVYIWGI
ncbi:D-alanyl-D-alanine carboxypeptidase [Lachnospiraceae bacterium TWA4]|nr:D-alanyl-D-alanine carboxypeptidase [Lachnospiraceae bacterium TWA4]